jgi:hypothetical protein
MRWWRAGCRSSIVALFGTAVLLAGVLPAAWAVSAPSATSSTAAVAELPLGKRHFAIAVGGLRVDSVQNWVRLGLYDFAEDGTVTERHWHWSQRKRVVRSYTGFQASGCPSRDCEVQTGGGYESSTAPESLAGTYTVEGDRLRITWNGGLWEEWTLSERAGGALAAVEHVDNNFGMTYGFGYGSNAGWDARVSAEQIAAIDHETLVHRYHLWKTSEVSEDPYIDEGDGDPPWVTDWTECGGGECLGAVTDGGTDPPSPSEHYVAPASAPADHRRDAYWHWRRSHADDQGRYCYNGNSHVKPMLQIVDDNGAFHGWVGVEASLNQTTNNGPYDDDIGIFRIAD